MKAGHTQNSELTKNISSHPHRVSYGESMLEEIVHVMTWPNHDMAWTHFTKNWPLVRESTGHQGFLLTKSYALMFSLLNQLLTMVNETVNLPVFWDKSLHMWHKSNVITLYLKQQQQQQLWPSFYYPTPTPPHSYSAITQPPDCVQGKLCSQEIAISHTTAAFPPHNEESYECLVYLNTAQ